MKVRKQQRVVTGLSTSLSREDRLNTTGYPQTAATMARRGQSTITAPELMSRGGPASPAKQQHDDKLPVNFSGSLFGPTLLTTERCRVVGLLPDRPGRLDWRDAPRQEPGHAAASTSGNRKNEDSVGGPGGILRYEENVAGHSTEEERFNHKVPPPGSVPTRWDERGYQPAKFSAKQRGREELERIVREVDEHDKALDAARLKAIKEVYQRVEEYVAREEAHAVKVFQRENPILRSPARKDYPPHMRSSNATLW